MLVRKLDENDIDIIKELDEATSNVSLSELITDEDSSIYGLFNDENKLIGYTYIESAEEASSSKYWNQDSIMISTLFILEEYKSEESIEYFIEYLIGILDKSINIFVNVDRESDKDIFLKFGFIDDGGSMVKIVNNSL